VAKQLGDDDEVGPAPDERRRERVPQDVGGSSAARLDCSAMEFRTTKRATGPTRLRRAHSQQPAIVLFSSTFIIMGAAGFEPATSRV